VAAVVNGGIYHQPTIIASVTDADGLLVPQSVAEPRRVLKPETSAAVLDMMRSVTESPMYFQSRSLPGYHWAGKTGTADRYDEQTGSYLGTTASFIGVGPAKDPQVLVYVVLDNPDRGTHGADYALPTARDLMMVALPHYGIAPVAKISPYKKPVNY